MSSGHERPPKTRKVVSATCAVHPGTPGYCNVEVRREDDDLIIHPHATGACVLVLDEFESKALYNAIDGVLGYRGQLAALVLDEVELCLGVASEIATKHAEDPDLVRDQARACWNRLVARYAELTTAEQS